MKQSNITITKPEEPDLFEIVEKWSRTIRKAVSTAFRVIGSLSIVFGAFWLLGSIGAAENGALDVHMMIWQCWTGIIIIAAGACAWIVGAELR